MSRWISAVAIGCLIAMAAMVGVTALSSSDARANADSAESLARQLRCPDCQGLSVADSPTQSAREIRRQIDVLLADGATPDDVRAHFVARYGEWILLAPRSPILWILPWAAVLLAMGALVAWLVRDRPDAPPSGAPPATVHDRRRVREEAEALDA